MYKRTMNKELKARLKNSVDDYLNNHQKETQGVNREEQDYRGVKS